MGKLPGTNSFGETHVIRIIIGDIEVKFMFDYVFPQELEDAIDAATAKFGHIECAKKFLFYFMTESGVHDGEVWDCLAELSESSYSDPQYIAKVEDEDMDLVQISMDMQRAAGCPALDIVALVELPPAGMRSRIPGQV